MYHSNRYLKLSIIGFKSVCLMYSENDKILEQYKMALPEIEEFNCGESQKEFERVFGITSAEYINRRPNYLIRVVPSKYSDNLLSKGEIRMGSLDYYRNMEYNNDGRADVTEGALTVFQSGQILIGNPPTRISENKTTIYQYSDKVNKGFVYCLYGCYDNIFDGKVHEIEIPDQMHKMGESKILIFNPGEFIRRCAKAAKEQGLTLVRGSVNYYDDETLSLKWHPFIKPKSYSYQSEYRLYCPTTDCTQNNIFLNIGPINDIAVLIDRPMFLVAIETGKVEIRELNSPLNLNSIL